MSATTERLLEEIEGTKRALEACKSEGNNAGVTHLTEVLELLNQQLTSANQALTEGKQLLKS